jgi:hypothetical protein
MYSGVLNKDPVFRVGRQTYYNFVPHDNNARPMAVTCPLFDVADVSVVVAGELEPYRNPPRGVVMSAASATAPSVPLDLPSSTTKSGNGWGWFRKWLPFF